MSNIKKLTDYEGNIVYPEISEEQIEHKVDKAEGMGLSSNDFTDELKQKLELIRHITKVSELKQDIPYLLDKDLNPLREDIASNTQLINDEISAVIDMVENIDVPEVDLSDIKNELSRLETEKADKNAVEQSLLKLIDEMESALQSQANTIDSKLNEKQDRLSYTPEDKAKRGKADGYTPLNAHSKIPLQYIPDIAKQQTYVVDTIDEMHALDDLIIGEKCFIVEDSDTYIWDGESWLVVSKAEWENISLDWENIENRPETTQEQIDEAVDKSHNHDNVTQLNKVSEQMFDDIFDARMHILSGKIHLNDEDMAAIADVSNKADKNDVYNKTQVDERINKKADTSVIEQIEADTQRVEEDIAKRLGATIPRNVDVDYNDFIETGFYFIAPRQVNRPPELWNTSIYLTVVATEGNIYQRAVTYNTGQIAKRQYTNGRWDDWQYDLDLTSDNIQKELGYTPVSEGQLTELDTKIESYARITTSETQPDNMKTGDYWYQIVE